MRQVLSFCSPLLAVIAVALALGAATISVRAQDGSPVVDVSSGNPEMNAAIARARVTLPKFFTSLAAPQASETGHSLKVRIPYATGKAEHIWVVKVIVRDGGVFWASFANAPRHLPGKRVGDNLEFREADITDWMFLRNEKIVGGETIRPMLKLMTKADADALRARLETP